MGLYRSRGIYPRILFCLSAIVMSGCASTIEQPEKGTLTEALVQIKSRPGIEQKFILIKPAHPTAAVILCAGGHGGLRLSSGFEVVGMQWGQANFLVRTRRQFADHGFVVAVIDSPPDRKEMDPAWRMGPEHAQDIHAVVQFLKKQGNLPVWLIGTSMGTISASNAAIRLGAEVSGLVLTSTITRSVKKWSIYSSHPDAVLSMALDRILIPTLIVAHKHDGCIATPPGDAEKLKLAFKNASKTELEYFSGGKMAESAACNAKSAHGYYGIEDKVVSAVAGFIRSN